MTRDEGQRRVDLDEHRSGRPNSVTRDEGQRRVDLDEHRSGRPNSVTRDEGQRRVDAMIQENRRIKQRVT